MKKLAFLLISAGLLTFSSCRCDCEYRVVNANDISVVYHTEMRDCSRNQTEQENDIAKNYLHIDTVDKDLRIFCD